jgi:hypothetical protein
VRQTKHHPLRQKRGLWFEQKAAEQKLILRFPFGNCSGGRVSEDGVLENLAARYRELAARRAACLGDDDPAAPVLTHTIERLIKGIGEG